MLYFHFEYWELYYFSIDTIKYFKLSSLVYFITPFPFITSWTIFYKQKKKKETGRKTLLPPFFWFHFSLERKINLFDIDMQSRYEEV